MHWQAAYTVALDLLESQLKTLTKLTRKLLEILGLEVGELVLTHIEAVTWKMWAGHLGCP